MDASHVPTAIVPPQGLRRVSRRVEKETDVQVPRLWDDTERFRPNIQADDGWDFGDRSS